MADLKMNTEAVVTAANNIKQYNAQIRDGFPNVQSAINRLDNSWDGAAAVAAITKFNQMKDTFCNLRYKVLDSYANFLLQQVGEGYTQTEDVNIALAEQFK